MTEKQPNQENLHEENQKLQAENRELRKENVALQKSLGLVEFRREVYWIPSELKPEGLPDEGPFCPYCADTEGILRLLALIGPSQRFKGHTYACDACERHYLDQGEGSDFLYMPIYKSR
jgi:hypothetical protein